MTPKPPSPARMWFHRSVALTLVLGACLLLLVATRPGYGPFFVMSTLAFLLAGFLWSPDGPPDGGLRARVARRSARLVAPLSVARSYRISAARR